MASDAELAAEGKREGRESRLESFEEAIEELPSRRWWALGVIALAQLMVVLDGTVVTIALPSAQRALHISNADRQWVVTAYTLAFGGLLLLGGRIGDYLGRKRIFLVGLVGFAAASALGGAAQNGATLFGARAIQGLFAALLAPAA
jgi:MFS family permease